ncbi:MAG: c-type cytochrome [Chitinophagaceae bacterium]|nr:c-type cytochrome [Chitinophagaceae bacterium]
MKKYFIAVLAFALLTACGGNAGKEEKEGTAEEKKEVAPDLSADPVYQAGLAIVGKSDCLTCHKVDEKIQGPTYRDVANKYAGYPDTIVTHLAKKVIEGGTGVWGEIPMIPHPALTQEEAEAAVKYILLLKNK